MLGPAGLENDLCFTQSVCLGAKQSACCHADLLHYTEEHLLHNGILCLVLNECCIPSLPCLLVFPPHPPHPNPLSIARVSAALQYVAIVGVGKPIT